MLGTATLGRLCLQVMDRVLGNSRAVSNACEARDRDLALARTRPEAMAALAAQSRRWEQREPARSGSAR